MLVICDVSFALPARFKTMTSFFFHIFAKMTTCYIVLTCCEHDARKKTAICITAVLSMVQESGDQHLEYMYIHKSLYILGYL